MLNNSKLIKIFIDINLQKFITFVLNMKRIPKILKELISSVILLLLILPLFLALIIQTEYAQQYIINKLSTVASKHLDSRVSIDRFYYKLFNRVDVGGFYVEDPINRGDTLLYVKNLEASINIRKILTGDIYINSATIDGGLMKLKSDSLEIVNIKYLVDKLKPEVPDTTNVFKLYIDQIDIDSFNFSYQKSTPEGVEYGVDFTDLAFIDIKTSINKFDLFGDSMSMQAEHMSFREKGDVTLNHLDTERLIVSNDLISLSRANIELDNSHLELKEFSMKFKEWGMTDFVNDVRMTATIIDSQIEMSTVERFTKMRQHWRSNIKVIGSINGTVANLNANIRLATTHNTQIENTKINITGLPFVNKTTFDAKITNISTNAEDIYNISEEFTNKPMARNDIIERVGNISLTGNFKGSPTKFDTKGEIKTSVGDVTFAVSNTRSNDIIEIDGTVDSNNLHLGALLNSKDLGRISITNKLKGKLQKNNSNIVLNSTINSVTALGYNYSNINIQGLLTNKMFNGEVASNDKNLNFGFNGEIDFNNAIPNYDFNLKVQHANLHALNLNNRDSVSIFSGEVYANGTGTTIDNINGDIILEHLKYINHVDTVDIEKISIINTNNEKGKSMKISSKLVDISLTAKQSYNDIIPYLSSTINNYLPALSKKTTNKRSFKIDNTNYQASQEAKNSFYIATINVKEANNAAGIFMPGLKIAKGSKLSFIFNPALNQFSLNFNSSLIKRGDYWAKGINITSRSEADSISMYTKADEINIANIFLPNFELIGGIDTNNVVASAYFNNTYDGSKGLVSAKIAFEKTDSLPKITAQILPSYVDINKVKWILDGENIVYDNNALNIDMVRLHTEKNKQSISVTGGLSKDINDSLTIDIKNFDISGVTVFTKPIGYDVNGRVTGDVIISKTADKNIIFDTNLSMQRVKLNDYTLPDFGISSRHLGGPKVLYSLSYAGKDILNTTVNLSTYKFHSTLKMKEVDLSALNPLLATIGSNSLGLADIDVTIDNLNMPLAINGDVKIHNFETTIDFTNVRYKLSGEAKIKNNMYNIYNGVITDPNGVTSPFTGSLNGNDRYRRVRYRIAAKPNRLQCLSTTINDNPQFYGDVRASGDIEILGHGTQVTMKIDAAAVDNSRFYMPLSNKATISEADFITFAKPKNAVEEEKPRDLITIKKKKQTGTDALFSIDMNIKAQNDTEVQIVIDPTLGDIIKAKGMGELNINIVPQKSIFSITGGYEIDTGSYLFTLPNFQVLNKYFVIRPGSTISWTGDPLAANLNITAIYKTKTSLAPLLGQQNGQRVEVDCNLSLNGKLLKPDITLGIDVPDADPETSRLLASILNSEEAISKQLFWLLFANTFYTEETQTSTNVAVGMMNNAEAVGTVTGIEFLSNQISNWISNDKFDIGFNYRPRNDMFSSEVELNFSAPLFNDRIILEAEGNYDFQNNETDPTQQNNPFSGNFNITYILNKSGNFRAKAFTRPMNTFDENLGRQESGAGIYYKDNFDKFDELIEKFLKNNSLRKLSKQKKLLKKEAVKEAKDKL